MWRDIKSRVNMIEEDSIINIITRKQYSIRKVLVINLDSTTSRNEAAL